MRLDKFVSHCSGLSRKQARARIIQGAVTVDGAVQRDITRPTDAGQQVALDQQPLTLPGKRYLMLHKPAGYVCARSDGEHPTVLDLLPPGTDLQIVGRLDLDTTGLLLLTDDGQWNHRITTPSSRCAKTYRVHTADPLSPDLVDAFARGVQLRSDPQPTRPARLEILRPREALITLEEGRYHQVKRMFASAGNRVTALHRETLGKLRLDPNLKPGDYRELSADEVAAAGSAI